MSIVNDFASIRRAMAEPEPHCETCEGSGWVFSSYQASGGPNLEECPDCHNPEDLPCP